jgi:hypothetical protein
LLLEPQRTNLVTFSEQFNNAAWSKYQSTITANVIASPDGSVNADKFLDSTANDGHSLYAAYTISADTTFSIFVKSAEYTRFAAENLSDGGSVIFNLSTATVVSTSANYKNAKIENYGNGWYRISATTNGVTGAKAMGWALVGNAGSLVFTGTGTSGVYVYGAQAEVGAYATSYIPTPGASSVTRVADAASKTGISSLIGTEFTLFFDGFDTVGGASTRYIVLKGTGGTYANALILESNSSNQLAVYLGDNSSNSIFGAISSALTNGQRMKFAIACKNSDIAFYLNGSLVASQSSGTIPTMSDLYLGYYVDYSDNYCVANQTLLFPTRLTNAQLAELTTL